MSNREIITIAEFTLCYQLLMIRRIPQYIQMIEPSEHYEIEVKKYAQILVDLGDNAYSMHGRISTNDLNGLINEISCMADFLLDISDDIFLIDQLNARDTIRFYKESDLIKVN